MLLCDLHVLTLNVLTRLILSVWRAEYSRYDVHRLVDCNLNSKYERLFERQRCTVMSLEHTLIKRAAAIVLCV